MSLSLRWAKPWFWLSFSVTQVLNCPQFPCAFLDPYKTGVRSPLGDLPRPRVAGRNSRDSQRPIPSTLESRYAESLPSKTPHLFRTLSLEFKGPPAIQTFLKRLSAPCWVQGSTDMKLSKHQSENTSWGLNQWRCSVGSHSFRSHGQ